MKKKLSILLILCLMFAMFTACGREEEQTAEEPQTEITATADSEETTKSEESDPAVIKSLDAYEELSNQYIEIATKYFKAAENGKKKKMKSFKDDYDNLKSQFDEMNKKIDSIDYSSLCASDAAYYDEITTRVTNNVASLLEKHADAVQMIMEMNAK